MISVDSFLKLGRVSNLPTVWTNTLAGALLAAPAAVTDWRLFILVVAMTLAYTGGMFLNDAFDREIDARERPERPIPSGAVTARRVFTLGFGMLAASIVLVAICALSSQHGAGLWAIVSSIALCGAIVLYNVWHKANPISPFIMGLCRMLVYITAGLTLSASPPSMLYIAAGVVLCYLIGLTYTAKQENIGEVKNLWPLIFLAAPVVLVIAASLTANSTSNAVTLFTWILLAGFVVWVFYALSFVRRRGPGDIPRAVVSMIAGISLIDAILISMTGSIVLAIVALGAFMLTLFLQQYIAGT